MVNCWNCNADFDCLSATWCACVTREPSVICPHCDTCTCKAPGAVRRDFWSAAPTALWVKRMERNRFDAKRQRVQQPEAAQVDESKPIVIVADDSRLVRMMLREVVERTGCTVMEAADGVEALRLAQQLRPRLVIADALMPKMDGREMARILKSDATTAAIRIVIVTGLYTARRYSVEALQKFNADAYLTKPVDPGQIESIVRQVAA